MTVCLVGTSHVLLSLSAAVVMVTGDWCVIVCALCACTVDLGTGQRRMYPDL